MLSLAAELSFSRIFRIQLSGLVACILKVVYLRSIHNLGVNGDCVGVTAFENVL